MKITTMTNASPGFYATMGPYLSRREIAKEMGGPIWDDDGKMWFVATERSSVVGFCALRGNVLCSAYVRPLHRGKRIYEALFVARLNVAPPGLLRSVVRKSAIGTFRRHGFKAGVKRGGYTTMTKEAP